MNYILDIKQTKKKETFVLNFKYKDFSYCKASDNKQDLESLKDCIEIIMLGLNKNE